MPSAPVKFLLVDDLEENLLALEGLLRRDGLELLTARSGTEALELLLVHDVALAILDIQMPEMDGFELAEFMRGTQRTRHVPIIFLTAGGVDDQRRFRGYETGAVDFLYKPVEPHVLQSKVDVFFELYRQRQEVERQRDELRVIAQENARLLEESQRTAEALRRREAELAQLNSTLEQRVAERTSELAARNEELQQFAHAASHDFQEPLRKIQLFASLLMEAREKLDDESWEYVERMQSAAARMSQLLQDMLAFTRVNARSHRAGKVHLPEVIEGMLRDLELSIEETGAQIVVDANVTLEGDENQIRQVLNHLLLNALKYRKRGVPPEIRITAAIEVPKKDLPPRLRNQKLVCRIDVEDNGIGLDPKYAERIFRPFERLHSKTVYPGTGMGLAICRRIVGRHGGTITVDSLPGKGSRFTITLPMHSAGRGMAREQREELALIGSLPGARQADSSV